MNSQTEQSGVVDWASTKTECTCDQTTDETDRDKDDQCSAFEENVAFFVIDSILNFNLLLCRVDLDWKICHYCANNDKEELDSPVDCRAHLYINRWCLWRTWLQDVDCDDDGKEESAHSLFHELQLTSLFLFYFLSLTKLGVALFILPKLVGFTSNDNFLGFLIF